MPPELWAVQTWKKLAVSRSLFNNLLFYREYLSLCLSRGKLAQSVREKKQSRARAYQEGGHKATLVRFGGRFMSWQKQI